MSSWHEDDAGFSSGVDDVAMIAMIGGGTIYQMTWG
jgi:hypothetical protein